MRRIWMGTALLLALAACRERSEDQALGTERRGQETQAPDGRQAIDARRGIESPGAKADRERLETTRVLAALQAMNRSEIDTSKLADTHAASPQVKQYAAKLVADHQQALDRINQLVQQKHVDLGAVQSDPFVAAQTAAGTELRDRLSKLQGADFDSAYLAAQPEQHALYSKLAQQGQQVSNEGEFDQLFTQLDSTAHDHQSSALATTPRSCGGEMQGMLPGQQGMQGTQPDMQGTQPGMQGAQPGMQGTQPGMQGTQPGMQGAQPGTGQPSTGQPGVGPGTGQGSSNPGMNQPGGTGRDTGVPGPGQTRQPTGTGATSGSSGTR